MFHFVQQWSLLYSSDIETLYLSYPLSSWCHWRSRTFFLRTQSIESQCPSLENLSALVTEFRAHETIDQNIYGGVDDWKGNSIVLELESISKIVLWLPDNQIPITRFINHAKQTLWLLQTHLTWNVICSEQSKSRGAMGLFLDHHSTKFFCKILMIITVVNKKLGLKSNHTLLV